MKIKTIHLFILACLFLAEVQAQKIPMSLPSKNGLTASIPKLPAKPVIPYLKELRQIKSLKKSYDSLRNELVELKEITQDSTQRDSLFTLAKDRSKQVLEQESKTLESLITSEDIPGEDIRNAAQNTLEKVNESKARLAGIKDVGELENLVDLNNENLKALTNEWLMPKVEEQLKGVMKEGLDPTNASQYLSVPDFYGKDALTALTKKGLPSEMPFDQAKEMAKEKALHISDEYIQKAGKDFSKLKFDTLGKRYGSSLADAKRKKGFRWILCSQILPKLTLILKFFILTYRIRFGRVQSH